MPIDLDKFSGDLVDALERARWLAESRQQAQITPVDMLDVFLNGGSALASRLERSGVACGALLDAFATRLTQEPSKTLEPGKAPVASRGLRDLIEKSFEKTSERGSECAGAPHGPQRSADVCRAQVP